MDVEPPVGDDLNRMLVSMKQEVLQRAAAEPPAKPRPWARRHLGLTLGLVALLGIGGASGALALVLPSPFEAAAPASPTSTPEPSATPRATATPTFTPTAPEQDPVPRPALALDCSTLGDRTGIGGLIENASVVTETLARYRPSDAAYRQAQAVRCMWGGDNGQLSATIVPAGPRGLEWVSGLRDSGLATAGAGDASAIVCDDPAYGCSSSMVVGPWWVETYSYTYGPPPGNEITSAPETISPFLTRVASTLAEETPGADWEPPTTRWSTLDSCDDLAGVSGIPEILGTPEIQGPIDRTYAEEKGIRQTQISEFACEWTVRVGDEYVDTDVFSPDQVLSVLFMVTPASGWAFGTETPSGTPVSVRGADAAVASCIDVEFDGPYCSLDVLVDDTWLYFSGGEGMSRSNSDLLVPVAEAVIDGFDG